ncbi:MAG TPA: prephenate dehydratase [Solirubrobacteraceae bacterium]|nr:prephenate dehydratase [Solirubrobacteraceae bacterium]
MGAAGQRLGYFGPAGTFTHEALLDCAAPDEARAAVPFSTIYEAIMAVDGGAVERVLVPIENSLEGAVNVTLDTLALDVERVAIVGEVVHPIEHCLIARDELALETIEVVLSHPQATAQCARFIRERLGGAEVRSGGSTADAVRTVAEHGGRWAALGNRRAAELYGCRVLMAGVEDVAGNETRFVWLARRGRELPGEPSGAGQKTAVVFWGAGAESPGWLVRCLSELAVREVNLTRIESRPRKQGLGHYMFFLDLEGSVDASPVAEGLDAVRGHVDTLRVLGSFPAA